MQGECATSTQKGVSQLVDSNTGLSCYKANVLTTVSAVIYLWQASVTTSTTLIKSETT